MESTTYDINTIWNKRGKPPVVRIEAGKNARINFSVEAVKLLGLHEGMRLAFRTYKNDPGIVYFYEQATGLLLKKQMEGKSGIRLAIYCRPLAAQLIQHFGYKEDNNKTILLKADQVPMPGTKTKAWFINKDNLHKPIKWK